MNPERGVYYHIDSGGAGGGGSFTDTPAGLAHIQAHADFTVYFFALELGGDELDQITRRELAIKAQLAFRSIQATNAMLPFEQQANHGEPLF